MFWQMFHILQRKGREEKRREGWGREGKGGEDKEFTWKKYEREKGSIL